MVRANHPNNVKRQDVCVCVCLFVCVCVCAYIRDSLPVCNFSNSYLSECLTPEVIISNKKGYVITLYRSPSQTSDKFDSFISNLEQLLINIVLINIVLILVS